MPVNKKVPYSGPISLINDIMEARKIDGSGYTGSSSNVSYDNLRDNAIQSQFDPDYAGNPVPPLSSINSFSQWRGYPVVRTLSCGISSNYNGGVSYPTQINYNFGSATGTISFSFNPYNFPDRLIVKYNNAIQVDTGYVSHDPDPYNVGSSRNTFKSYLEGKIDPYYQTTYPDYDHFTDGYPLVFTPFSTYQFDKSLSTVTTAEFYIYAPLLGTAWNITGVTCP